MDGQIWSRNLPSEVQPVLQSIESDDKPFNRLFSFNDRSSHTITSDVELNYDPFWTGGDDTENHVGIRSSVKNTNRVQAFSPYDFTEHLNNTVPDRSRSLSNATPAITEASSYSASHVRGGQQEDMASMLYRCLREAPKNTRSLDQIYTWVERACNKAPNTKPSWGNTVRHNLSQNGDFKCLPKKQWTLTSEALARGPRKTAKWRNKVTKGKGKRQPASAARAQQRSQSSQDHDFDDDELAFTNPILPPGDVFDFSSPPNISTPSPRGMPSMDSHMIDFSTTTPQSHAQTPCYTIAPQPTTPCYPSTIREPTPNYELSPSFTPQHDALSLPSWTPNQPTTAPMQQQFDYQPFQQQQQQQQQIPYPTHQQDFHHHHHQPMQQTHYLAVPNTATAYNFTLPQDPYSLPPQPYHFPTHQQQQQQPYQDEYQQPPTFATQQYPSQYQQQQQQTTMMMIDPSLSAPSQMDMPMQTPMGMLMETQHAQPFSQLDVSGQQYLMPVFMPVHQDEVLRWMTGEGKGKGRVQ